MGMGVYGKAATTEAGKYFCRNVWGWHPLWDACLYFGSKVKGIEDIRGHTNDGDGLDAEKSKQLAAFLCNAFDTGDAKIYCDVRDYLLAKRPDERCILCGGTGHRNDVVLIGKCISCKGKGLVRPFETNYYLEAIDFNQFAVFLESSGGFEIC